jgi:L-malate glycosyltransferase
VTCRETRRSAPMVIGQICHGSLGGSSRVACRLANALTRRGHLVHTFSYGPIPWHLDERIHQHILRKSEIDFTAPLYQDWTLVDRESFAALLLEVLEAQRFEILHYHYALPFAGIMNQIASHLDERMPVTIGTLHGTDLTRSLSSDAALAALDHDLSTNSGLTTVSQHMRRLCACLPSAHRDLRVLPNFVEDDWPQTDCSEALQFRPSSQQAAVLHVSNFRATKDVSWTVLSTAWSTARLRLRAAHDAIGLGSRVQLSRRRTAARTLAAVAPAMLRRFSAGRSGA